MSAPDNPAAFPLAMTSETMDNHGMSLRDWFAGQALSGYVQSRYAGHIADAELLAEHAYRCADAMLAEREKGGAK